MSTSVRFSTTLSLAAIVGLVPFAIDMYLASLPQISQEFTAPVWVTQLTLTGYLLLLGLGQLFAGPLSDAIGRRKPLMIGLALFIVGSVVAALAPNITTLVLARLLQGVGGALAAVVATSTVRDRAEGPAAMKLFAVLMTVSALAPIVAPAAGGLLEGAAGWRSVFWTLAGLGVIVSLTSWFALPESLPKLSRHPLKLRGVLSAYSTLLRTSSFSLPLAALATMFMLLFAYIGGASYVYQDQFGISPQTFGLVFGGTGAALMLGAIVANRFAEKTGAYQLSIIGIIISLIGAAAAVLVTAATMPLGALVAAMSVAMFGLGLSEPALMSLCMSAVQRHTGQAAALIGAGQFALGAVATTFAGILAARGALPWVLLLVGLAIVALVLAVIGSRSINTKSSTMQTAEQATGVPVPTA
ncbi:multidrug effflux MFS transporter [Citricoccus alkalitolerans]